MRSLASLLLLSPLPARGFTPDLPPLLIYWSATHGDNAVVATLAGAASLDATYSLVHTGALLASNGSACAGGSAPLNLYANAAAHHHFTAASARGAAWAAANGFALVGAQGCVQLSDDSGAAVALEQWSSAERGDHFLVGDAESRADAAGAGYVFEYIDSYTEAPWVVWPNEPHPAIPWPRSADLLDVELAWGHNAVPLDISADTWYPSWASDGSLYSSFTDGTVAGVTSHSYSGQTATTGYASFTVHPDSRGRPDPFNMTMFNVATFEEPAGPYESRYPSLNFVLNGVWYYGTYALDNYQAGVDPPPNCGNWCR